MAETFSTSSADGTIQFQHLTPKYLTEALNLIGDHFYPHENAAKAIGMSDLPGPIGEMKEFISEIAKDGISLIAVDKSTDEVVGAAFNKFLIKGETIYEKFAEKFKYPQSRYLMHAILKTDNALYDALQIDCAMEIMFLVTSTKARGKGIAKKLSEMSVELAKKLVQGINVKQSLDDKVLSLEPVPKIVCAVFTTFITQRIGRHLGFEILTKINYDTLEYEGRKYSDYIGKETDGLTVEYMKF